MTVINHTKKVLGFVLILLAPNLAYWMYEIAFSTCMGTFLHALTVGTFLSYDLAGILLILDGRSNGKD